MDLETVRLFIFALIPFYTAAIALYTYRIVRGPTIPDMVLATDCLGYVLAAFLVILSIYFSSPILIAPAIVLTLWIFALDVFVSKYLEKKELGE